MTVFGVRRALLASAPFTPRDLPGKVAWYAARLTHGYTDSAAVDSLPDLFGNGHTATAADAKRPAYRTSVVNGQPALRFDGASDILFVNSLATHFTGSDKPHTLAFVLKKNSNVGVDTFFSATNSADTNPLHRFETSTAALLTNRRDDSGNLLSPAGGSLDTGWHVVVQVFSGTTITLYLDGVVALAATNANVNAATIDQCAIGGQQQRGATAEGNYADMDLAEMVVLSDALPAALVSRLGRYWGSLYGITVL